MKRVLDTVFCVLFIVGLLIPAVFTNFKVNQVSDIDNTNLPEINWKENVTINERITQIESYLNMRIGFRSISLDLYQQLNDKLFHLLEHPLYMYGKEKWVYFRDKRYTDDYQHLNLNSEWTKSFVEWMQRFNDIAVLHGIQFYYMLIPDKKTNYPEYFPDGYNVRGMTSRTDIVLDLLKNTSVNHIYYYDVLKTTKEHMLVNNKTYDAGHWNQNGAFVCMQFLMEHLRMNNPEIPPMSKEEFVIGTEHKDSLQVSHFAIDEDVPTYTLVKDPSISDMDWFKDNPITEKLGNEYHTRYLNTDNSNLPKVLVLMDSYMMDNEKYFLSRFSEVTFIHRTALKGPNVFEMLIDAVKPDIIIYENPERVFPILFSEAE